MSYIPPTSHITLLATLRRERMLPIPGEVLIQAGQHVEAADVVAQVYLPEAHRLLDVARLLGVPKEKAADLMTKQEGELVAKGEAIAQRKTLFGAKSVPSPVEGRLVLYEEGRALLTALSKFELRAGFPGTVVNTFGGHGVVVETTGALLEGVWGNGRDDFSALRMVSASADAPLQGDDLDLSLRGAVIAAGRLADSGPLKTLNDVGVRGLIVGSAPTEMLPALQKLAFPVLLTDGFGAEGLSDAAFKLLNGNSGREVWVNARARDRFADARPEAIIPLPSPDLAPPPPTEGEALAEGKRVRVVRGAETGRVGTVIGLSDRLVALPNGIRTRVAAVSLDEVRGARPTVTVPFANLEILE
jgi:hypothetical protein